MAESSWTKEQWAQFLLNECSIDEQKANVIGPKLVGLQHSQLLEIINGYYSTTPASTAATIMALEKVGFEVFDIISFVAALRRRISNGAKKEPEQPIALPTFRPNRICSSEADFVCVTSPNTTVTEVDVYSFKSLKRQKAKVQQESEGTWNAHVVGLEADTFYTATAHLVVEGEQKELPINFTTKSLGLAALKERYERFLYFTKYVQKDVDANGRNVLDQNGKKRSETVEEEGQFNCVTMMSPTLFASFSHGPHEQIERGNPVTIYRQDNTPFICNCIYKHVELDLVLFKSNAPVVTEKEAPTIGNAKSGTEYVLLGVPNRYPGEVAALEIGILEGVISNRHTNNRNVVEVLRGTSASEPGFSGGPVFSKRKGLLIGINVQVEHTGGLYNPICRIVPLFHRHHFIAAESPYCGMQEHSPQCKIDDTH